MDIVKYKDFERRSSNPVKVRVTFWNMCDDVGDNCYDVSDVEDIVAQVKTEYLDYNISLQECIIHNHNSSQNLFSDRIDNPAPIKCESINYYFYRYGTPSGIGGQGGEGWGWGKLNFETTMHELGHIFGLPHTFNCVGLKENIKRPDCDPSGPNCQASCLVNCETAGDGFCDTPAYIRPDALQDNSLCTTVLVYQNNPVTGLGIYNIGNFTDDCGNLYHDNDGVLLRNYMSYSGDSRIEFTDDQADHMFNKINVDYSEFIGEVDHCPAAPLYSNNLLSGSIGNKSQVVIDGVDICSSP